MITTEVDYVWSEELLQKVVGRQLSSVEFVQDYVQLRFDGPVLTAITQPIVLAGSARYHWGCNEYRNELCNLITKIVVTAQLIPHDAVRITFDNGTVIAISLRDQDYRAAEAVKFDFDSSEWWVI